MTELICLKDSYQKKCTSIVQQIIDNDIVFDKTVFYPRGGGQPCDDGTIKFNDKSIKVISVRKENNQILHTLDSVSDIKLGDVVTSIIDWEKRYNLMRMHTAAHALSSILHKNTGALITGNQLKQDVSRFDFNLKNFDRDLIAKSVEETNYELNKAHDVNVFELKREEAMKIPGVIKLANALPPSISKLRIVKIGNIDTQADGGTHVKNTKEVGSITIKKLDNKGKGNRRIYFTLILPAADK